MRSQSISTLKMWTMKVFYRGTIVTQLLAFLAASLHPSTSELPGDLQALKKAARTAAVWLLYLCKTSLSTSSKWKMSYLSSTGVDWLLTLSLETVFTKSTNKIWRWLLQLHVSPSLCVELEYILAPLHPSTSELPGDLRALKKATLVLNEGGDDWSPWNIGEWE